ncbi:MAG: hypothetical protein ACJ8H8_21925 [Geminicoccaceae bacterium]
MAICYYCSGSARCHVCSGTGVQGDGRVCSVCGGNGRCTHCTGGVMRLMADDPPRPVSTTGSGVAMSLHAGLVEGIGAESRGSERH